MIRPENRPAPAPRYSNTEPTYSEVSEAWARSLKEQDLRELAYECKRTPEQDREDYMVDALREYERRESLGLLKQNKTPESNPKSKKSSSRNDAQRKSRRSRV